MILLNQFVLSCCPSLACLTAVKHLEILLYFKVRSVIIIIVHVCVFRFNFFYSGYNTNRTRMDTHIGVRASEHAHKGSLWQVQDLRNKRSDPEA